MTLLQKLRARLRGRVAVIGIGNPSRGDDGAGCCVVERMTGSPDLLLFCGEEVPESILGQVIGARPETIVVVDAVDLDAEPGAVALLEAEQLTGYIPTTHRVPLSLFTTFVRQQSGARDAFVVAIQPGQLGFGPISPEVARSADLVADLLTQATSRGEEEEVRCR